MPTEDITSQLSTIHAAIVRNDARVHWHDTDIKKLKEDNVETKREARLYAEDIKLFMELIQIVAMRLGRVEEKLGIAERVVWPPAD